jgi:5-methylthioribose kinase
MEHSMFLLLCKYGVLLTDVTDTRRDLTLISRPRIESRKKHSNGAIQEAGERGEAVVRAKRPINYTEQSAESLPDYLATYAPNAMERLGATDAKDLSCIEMGDGNLNLVYIVTNVKIPTNQVIVKQALPYVRCVGEGWPMTIDRAYFEFKALEAERQACPQFVPAIYFFSKEDALMCMEYIAPPAIILRKGLIMGIHYPTVASDLGTFCARTLFKTSGFSLPPLALRRSVSEEAKLFLFEMQAY